MATRLATINVGTCACFGGLPAAAPNPTQALSTEQALPGIGPVINLSACPMNPENLTATLVYFLTYGAWPALDHLKRPLFAYGKTIHDNCERRAHYDAGQFARAWGDEGHRAGYCLYEMGCKGPVTYQNCPNIEWNGGTNWPVGCGHPCIGCAEPAFWDRMTPFYEHLGGAPGLGETVHVDTAGAWVAGGVAAAFGAHTLVQLGRRKLGERHDRKAKAEGAGPAGGATASKETNGATEAGGSEPKTKTKTKTKSKTEGGIEAAEDADARPGEDGGAAKKGAD